jgi:hypothetical protein
MNRIAFAAALLVTGTALAAQNAAPQPFEIYIDGQCRVYSQPNPTPAHPNPKAAFHLEDHVCHFESELTSNHWEYKPDVRGIPKSTYVTVFEHEYVLTNPLPQPVTFVIGQVLPKGWMIDSDPPPVEITNSLAIFRAVAQPGETIRVHVGAKN